MLNLCANNYLGLASHPAIVKAAHEALDRWGYGMASVRFICGTQEIHKQLERRISEFLGTEDTILYSSCFDANGGLFETLLGEEDAVISDELNHASIIDGIRLCKAQRARYKNGDMDDLEAKLKEAAGARFRLIATDGVFSMDGYFAKLADICDLADKYDALVMVDDSHAVGLHRRHRPRHATNTPASWAASTSSPARWARRSAAPAAATPAGRKEIIELLRQRSRPYLFSNSLAAADRRRLDRGARSAHEVDRPARPPARQHGISSATAMTKLGFNILPGEHPIVPIMLGDAALAGRMAERMLAKGVYVIGFSYPGRAARQSAHPHADVGRPHARRPGIRRREVRRSRAGDGSDLLARAMR